MDMLLLVHLPPLPSLETGRPDLEADLAYGSRVLAWAAAAGHVTALHDPRHRQLAEHGLQVLCAGVPFGTADRHADVHPDDIGRLDTAVVGPQGRPPMAGDHIRLGGWHRDDCVPAVSDRLRRITPARVSIVEELVLPTPSGVPSGTPPQAREPTRMLAGWFELGASGFTTGEIG